MTDEPNIKNDDRLAGGGGVEEYVWMHGSMANVRVVSTVNGAPMPQTYVTADDYAALRQRCDILYGEVIEAERARDGYRSAVYAKQARIDALMMEFCPGEMTADQKADWARHQKPVDDAALAHDAQQQEGK